MKVICDFCKGKKKLVLSKTCPTCKGLGSTKISLGTGKRGPPCPTCKGEGKLQEETPCPACKGTGFISYCELCGTEIENQKSQLCDNCVKNPTVYKLVYPLDETILKQKKAVLSRIEGKNKFGLQLDLGCDVKAEIKTKNLPRSKNFKIGDEIPVRIIGKDSRGHWEAVLVHIKDFKIKKVHGNVETYTIERLLKETPDASTTIKIRALILDIKQTAGPTSFTLIDSSGKIIEGAGFDEPGKRAFPNCNEDDVVDIIGYLSSHKGKPQLEIYDMELVSPTEAETVKKNIQALIDKQSEVSKDFKFLIRSSIYQKIRGEMVKAAQRIRKAILTDQNILIKYHHPCVDGACAGQALYTAIKQQLITMEKDRDEMQYLIKKVPQRSPFYDFVDVLRDVIFALDDQEKFGDKLPLIIVTDFGSTEESEMAYRLITTYNIETIIVDHHVTNPLVKQFTYAHINPYYVENSYKISGGMLAVELARMINPDPTLDEKLIPLAAIAGVADRVEGEEIEKYLKLAEKLGYDKEFIYKIIMVADYVLYNSKFSDPSHVLDDLFGTSGNKQRQRELVEQLYPLAKNMFDSTFKACLLNITTETPSDGFLITQIDVEKFSHRFTFPPPGKLTGAIHDHMLTTHKKTHNTFVTLGIGPDFIIFRSHNLIINFPKVIKEIVTQHPETGITGGGHESVGTLKFFEGQRDLVLQLFKNTLMDAFNHQKTR